MGIRNLVREMVYVELQPLHVGTNRYTPPSPTVGPVSNVLDDLLLEWLAHLRALDMWFHGAHLTVSGPTFSGDHAVLLERVYTTFHGMYDPSAERAVGLSGAATACPLRVTDRTCQILAGWGTPVGSDACEVISRGLAYATDFLSLLDTTHSQLEGHGLTLGLSNLLQGQADQVEALTYLLKQRTTENALTSPPIPVRGAASAQ